MDPPTNLRRTPGAGHPFPSLDHSGMLSFPA
jgi:hypothetical protein